MPVLRSTKSVTIMTLQDTTLSPDNDDTPALLNTSLSLIGAILLGGFVGLKSPASGEAFSQSIDITLQAMIFLLFFELRVGALFRSFQNIRFLALAWSANFLIIPVIGYGIASLVFSGQPLLFVGLMIYFLAPCTDWFLGFTRLAKGDTELGTTLIPINITTQLLLFPFWLLLFAIGTAFAEFSSIRNMLVDWFLVPLIAAQAVRFAVERMLPENWSAAVLSVVSRCVPFVLATLVFQLFATHIGEIAVHLDLAVSVAVAVLLFFISTFVAGEVLSRFGRLDYPQRALLSTTMAARNGPLMLALTAIAIPNQPLVFAVIVAGMLIEIPLLTALTQILLKLRQKR